MEIVTVFDERDGVRIPIVHSNYLNREVIDRIEKVRKHTGNYITLFVRQLEKGEYKAYFASCQTDEQLRNQIAISENDSKPGGYAGSIPLAEDGRVSSIFLNNRMGEFSEDEKKNAIRTVASNIDPGLFAGDSIDVIFDRQEEYLLDPVDLKIFKVLRK